MSSTRHFCCLLRKPSTMRVLVRVSIMVCYQVQETAVIQMCRAICQIMYDAVHGFSVT